MNSKSKEDGMKMGFPGLLTIALIVLKLTGYIDWSWWWVWSPLWGGFLFAFLILLLVELVKE